VSTSAVVAVEQVHVVFALEDGVAELDPFHTETSSGALLRVATAESRDA